MPRQGNKELLVNKIKNYIINIHLILKATPPVVIDSPSFGGG
jgi:hypothetical protein